MPEFRITGHARRHITTCASYHAHVVTALAAVCFGVAITACAGDRRPEPSSGEASRDASQDANALLARVVDSDGGSGAMAAVMIDGQLVWTGTVGSADMEANRALQPNDKLRIGSVSKALTSVLALRLHEQHVIDIDAPVGQYLPTLPAPLRAATIRQLGSHTAGVRHYSFANYAEANNVMYYARLADAFASWSGDSLLFAPGTQFEYSSIGFNIIGAVIEAATGTSFGDALQSQLSRPLQLASTQTSDPIGIVAGRARQYTVSMKNPMWTWMQDGVLINTIIRDDSDLYPSGGLLSSAEDLARFADRVFNSDFLTGESRRLLLSPAHLNDGNEVEFNERGEPGFYSLGWGLVRNANGAIAHVGHGGETNGAYALVRYFPAQRMSVAGIVNYNTVSGETAFFRAIGDSLPYFFTSKPTTAPSSENL